MDDWAYYEEMFNQFLKTHKPVDEDQDPHWSPHLTKLNSKK